VEEKTQKPKSGSVLGATLTMLFIHALIPVGLTFFLTYRVPEFRQTFADMQVALPAFTAFIIDLSDFAQRHEFFLPALAAAFLVLDGAVYYALRFLEERTWSRLWWGFVFLVEGAALAAMFYAVIMPYTRLIDAASR
jgi:type II secretory pathway component PulF